MALRSLQEHIRQTIFYEIGGILLITPIYISVFGSSGGDGFIVIAALSIATLLWFPLHNTVFDRLDQRLSGRLASDRPKGLRLVHALSLEISVCLITTPLLIWLGGHGLREAILVDLALSCGYAVYAYGFHIVYDHFRPVVRRPWADMALGAPYFVT